MVSIPSPWIDMRRLFIATLLLLWLPAARPAEACTCRPPGSPREERDLAAAVFSGRVVHVVEVDYMYRVLLEVDRTWKGIDGNTVVVYTALNSAACGVSFERGQAYLVYALFNDDILHTHLCTRTARLEDADEDLDALGRGEAVGRRGGLCGGPTPAAAVQSLLFLGIGLLLLRRRPVTNR
jgi:hypothetical protein